MWSAALAPDAHAAVCDAQDRNDLHAELRTLKELRNYHTGHTLSLIHI